jgi:hypothetical protein
LYRGINDFKNGYHPGTNISEGEKGNFVADPYNFVAGWTKHFSQLLNVHGVNDFRRTETHTAETLVPESSDFEVESVIEKLKSHKSPGIDQIPGENGSHNSL